MKKFLIGIVSLVAAVMLSSSAFGALSYETVPGIGEFSFDEGITVLAYRAVEPPPNPENVISQIEGWGSPWPGVGDVEFSYKFDSASGLTGSVDFANPVQIVVAKWGVGQTDEGSYAFLLDGYTTHFDWDLEVRNGMSHVEGYNAVPVPAAVWLLGSGVLGLVAVRRRRS